MMLGARLRAWPSSSGSASACPCRWSLVVMLDRLPAARTCFVKLKARAALQGVRQPAARHPDRDGRLAEGRPLVQPGDGDDHQGGRRAGRQGVRRASPTRSASAARPTRPSSGMAKRLGSSNFEFVVMAVNVQRQVGGSMAELLDGVGETVPPAPAVPAQGQGAVRHGPHVRVHPGRAAAHDGRRDQRHQPDLHGAAVRDPHRAHAARHRPLCSITFGAIVLKKIVSFRV